MAIIRYAVALRTKWNEMRKNVMNNILMIDFVIRCSFGILGVLMVTFGIIWGIISK